MGQYLSDPNSKYAQLRNLNTHKQQNTLAYDMPGYSEMQDLYKGSTGADSPDYMEKYAGMIDPMSFFNEAGMGGGGTDGAGGFGPVGASQLADFGEGAYELFDKFTPGMEYIAENQGVGEQELASRLGVSSTGMQRNIADQEAQQVRQMGRMGVDPTSGAWQAGAGERAMQGAQGLSGLQEQVRSGARSEDWKQRMEAAGIGLNVAGQGTDALGKASGAWNQALGTLSDVYGGYMSGVGDMAGVTENARQYDKGYTANLAQGLTGARPALDKTFYGMYKPQATWGENAPPGQANAMTAGVFGLGGTQAGKQTQIG